MTVSESDGLLKVEKLSVSFKKRDVLGRVQHVVQAVKDVSFEIDSQQTFGLVGESGSGKSTLGRAILRLVQPEDGHIVFDGVNVTGFGRSTPLSYRRDVQVVFQDPYSSLNPAHVAGSAIGEPITRHLGITGRERQRRVMELLERVGLAPYHAERYPSEFSGGQRQRIAIARALAAEPRMIICDEAVSALDVSTQAQVINLLESLQHELGVSYLFIAHDLAVVRHISHVIGVMYLGNLVETGPAERVYEEPTHPYTEMLLAAIPVPDPVEQRQRRDLRRKLRLNEKTSREKPERGCPFHPRCPVVMDVCRTDMPEQSPVVGGGMVRCHLHTSGPQLGGHSILPFLKEQSEQRAKQDAS